MCWRYEDAGVPCTGNMQNSACHPRAGKNVGLTGCKPARGRTGTAAVRGLAAQRAGGSEGWWLRGVALTQFFAWD